MRTITDIGRVVAVLLLAGQAQAGTLTPNFTPPPGASAPAPAVIGVPALAGSAGAVTGTLVATPEDSVGRLTLDIAFAHAGAPVTAFDVELTKRLHLIAVSGDLAGFVHVHADDPGGDGHFRLALPLPWAGPWHLYADTSPTGLGQQVLRFDVTLPGAVAAHATTLGRDGPYEAAIAPATLRAGQAQQVALHVTRAGRPAADLHPYLGVAAHVVLIDRASLSYLHVHAAAADADMGGMDMPGMAMSLPANATVPPDLTLHVEPPQPGDAAMWVQFIGGDAVRTVPLRVTVR